MKYLIDTHILLWMASEPKKLSRKIRDLISHEENEIYFSVAGIWELAIKISLGKLSIGINLEDFIQIQILDNGIFLLPIKKEHIFPLIRLPFHHRDPFDRLLISQAQTENLTILSADKIFKTYKVKSIF